MNLFKESIRWMLLNIARYHPELYKECKISPGQREMLEFVESRDRTTTAEVARHTNTSVQNAGQKLIYLAQRGLIHKREISDPTGGTINEFWACDKWQRGVHDEEV